LGGRLRCAVTEKSFFYGSVASDEKEVDAATLIQAFEYAHYPLFSRVVQPRNVATE
jgi:hypothetical protein